MKSPLHFTQLILGAVVISTLVSCNAFMTGFTEDKAVNSYMLVTGNPKNFGDQRLRYNKGFHRASDLTTFFACQCKDDPGFIYEYKTDDKRRGIRLYYPVKDSVFIFEEPEKGNIRSVIVEARKMNTSEQDTYKCLKNGKP